MFVTHGNEPKKKETRKMTDSLKTVRTRKAASTGTPQTQKAVKGQKQNNAGGFTFTIGDMDRAKRFLILGSEGTYYNSGATMSADNAKTIIKLASDEESSRELVDLIVEVSTSGRAPKQNPALFALAVAASHGTPASKGYAFSKLNAVARTGTTLFQFVSYAEQFRSWGRGLKNAVANWYLSKDVDKLAYQTVKYRNREGWAHRDLFRQSHPHTSDRALQGLGEWILRGTVDGAPKLVKGFTLAQSADVKDLPALIREYGLSWEMLPTEALNDKKVWGALLDGNVPLGALLRQLPRLTRIGIIAPLDDATAKIVTRLTDKDEIERARIHPIAILTAMKVYSRGRSDKGSSTWAPDRKIVDALDKAFYLAFKNVTPSGKRTLIGLDVSGSMDGFYGSEETILTPREATGAIALVTVATEPSTHVIGFTGGASAGYGYSYGRSRNSSVTSAGNGPMGKVVTNLDSTVSSSRRLDDVISDLKALPMGTTDCSLPMLYAIEEGLKVDTFIIMTDNETYAGRVHPHEALKQYRDKSGIHDAKLIVLSTAATKFSIASPTDPLMLDIPGFDSAAPQVIAEFSRGL
jgi:60 kDa SS-A/Ro ribonucleoprotein